MVMRGNTPKLQSLAINMKYFLFLFVFFCALFHIKANKVDDAYRYIDEVLSVFIPRFIDEFGMSLYELPNFAYNFQDRTHDGRASTYKIYYHTGNITGLNKVHRKSCKEPTWNFGNITLNCNVIFPEMAVKYGARLQSLYPITNGVRFKKLDFDVTGEIADMEVLIKITASPHLKTATIKDLTIVDGGRPGFRAHGFQQTENLTLGILLSHFYQKFNEIFHEVFYDDYRKAFERAVQSIPYPFI